MPLAVMTGPDSSPRAESLKILAIHRYYWPDSPPYAVMLRRIVNCWAEDGHKVDVISGQPSYKPGLKNARMPACVEQGDNKVRRLSLPSEAGRPLVRLFNAFRLCSTIIVSAVLVRRYDVIMISTSPPVLGGVAASLAARLTGARFIYHCMDIHPEIGRISGEFRHPLVYRVLSKLDAWSCRAATPVVVLSDDMKEALRQRPGSERWDIRVLNNFSLPSGEGREPDALPFKIDTGKFTLLFAGNIGRFQGLDVLMRAMLLLRDREDIELVLMGDGAERTRLEALAKGGDAHVRFLGHHPVSVAKKAMREADVGFVSLVPGLYRYAYPSKAITYLEQGCPVLVAVEPESRLAQDVVDNELGLAVPPNDVEALVRAIRKLADSPELVEQMKQHARAVGTDRYAEAAVLPSWSRLVRE
jgi:colanic acid biosynthesis glycosyl transferase WcaI